MLPSCCKGMPMAPPGPMSTWPKPYIVITLRDVMSANALANQVWRLLWCAQSKPSPHANASEMEPRKRTCSPYGAARPPKAWPSGHCSSLPTNSLNSRWLQPSPRQPSARPVHKPPEATRTQVLGDAAREKRGLCGPHGRGPGPLSAPLGPTEPAGHHGCKARTTA